MLTYVMRNRSTAGNSERKATATLVRVASMEGLTGMSTFEQRIKRDDCISIRGSCGSGGAVQQVQRP